jgi:hypothetical protein
LLIVLHDTERDVGGNAPLLTASPVRSMTASGVDGAARLDRWSASWLQSAPITAMR